MNDSTKCHTAAVVSKQDGAAILRGESAHNEHMLADMSAWHKAYLVCHQADLIRMNNDLEVALKAPVYQVRV